MSMLNGSIGRPRVRWTVWDTVPVTPVWSRLAAGIAEQAGACRSRLQAAGAALAWADTRRQLEREGLSQERLAAWMRVSWSSPPRYVITQRKKPALARETLTDAQGKYITWKRAVAAGDADGQATAAAPRACRLIA
jgi:hypothetical protein